LRGERGAGGGSNGKLELSGRFGKSPLLPSCLLSCCLEEVEDHGVLAADEGLVRVGAGKRCTSSVVALRWTCNDDEDAENTEDDGTTEGDVSLGGDSFTDAMTANISGLPLPRTGASTGVSLIERTLADLDGRREPDGSGSV
jgi:hypothetical protein